MANFIDDLRRVAEIMAMIPGNKNTPWSEKVAYFRGIRLDIAERHALDRLQKIWQKLEQEDFDKNVDEIRKGQATAYKADALTPCLLLATIGSGTTSAIVENWLPWLFLAILFGLGTWWFYSYISRVKKMNRRYTSIGSLNDLRNFY